MRKVKILVGGKPIGEQLTWPYPKGDMAERYLIPVFKCTVSGINSANKAVAEQFNVLRFGVECKDGKTVTSVGIADFQSHIIKAWIPTYSPHSAASLENGAWQVYGNFLVHDGPDDSTEIFATIGCIEIMGKQGFIKFNDLIISLSGPKATQRPQQLAEIGRSASITIIYEKATRPPVKKAS